MKKSLSILAVLIVVSIFSVSSALAAGEVMNQSSGNTIQFDRDLSNDNPDYVNG